ncbi:acyl carrier protein [Anaerorhabdus furcosa]|uniref:Phosphopantetheine attachment site n=1 Tax=Anaerorhabdus furcosa TaxID=118967 RepID=A0A1T4NY67_9FIRM|nr:phosphopantetheine-binding protein [Anaerorhabdus furcosa]SJZ83996.1 Phosphopantetheine attachment site [Anaerorhabdus furcosa]
METFNTIKGYLEQSINKKCEVMEETTFEELGLDSFGVVDFALGLEEKFGITFFDEELHDINTIKDMVDVLNRHII